MRELDRIPTLTPLVRDRRRGPPRHRPRRCPARRRPRRRRPARPWREPGAAPTRCCCACPTPRSRAAAAAVPPGVPVGHCSGATGLDVLAGHEAFGLHPLMTVPAAGAPAVRRRRRRDRRLHAARARGRARRSPSGSGCAPTTVADEDRAAYHAAASHRLELPRHARGRGGAARRHRRRRARAARPARPRRGGELGAARRAATRSPARSRAATRPPSPASAPPSPSARPTCCRCSTRSPTPRAPRAGSAA